MSQLQFSADQLTIQPTVHEVKIMTIHEDNKKNLLYIPLEEFEREILNDPFMKRIGFTRNCVVSGLKGSWLISRLKRARLIPYRFPLEVKDVVVF